MTAEQIKKLKFNPVNLFLDTQKEIVRVQQMFKALSVAVTSSTFIASNEHNAVIVMIVFFFVDLLISCFRIE
jgi:hypothetical protein